MISSSNAFPFPYGVPKQPSVATITWLDEFALQPRSGDLQPLVLHLQPLVLRPQLRPALLRFLLFGPTRASTAAALLLVDPNFLATRQSLLLVLVVSFLRICVWMSCSSRCVCSSKRRSSAEDGIIGGGPACVTCGQSRLQNLLQKKKLRTRLAPVYRVQHGVPELDPSGPHGANFNILLGLMAVAIFLQFASVLGHCH